MLKYVVVLTGAGISEESGLSTFRDSGGLWENYRIEEVASIDAWYTNRQLVLDFYNIRRRDAAIAQPNKAHLAIAEAEKDFNVQVITQNVDDLHERAGSTNVLHLHGMLNQARSEKREDLVINIGSEPIRMGDLASDGEQLRPNIVWFGEAVPALETAIETMQHADAFLVIGTSLSVYPAASLIHYAPSGIPRLYVDPADPSFRLPEGWIHIKDKAGQGVKKALQILKEKLIKSD
ncbi:MAG TPA: Sir2 family NAD-dependent protein deacetylase [Balneolaceae bacterium]|nr:Sir2 family NAD-dependent protein deacetylase [Balneolaceae bacterium]